MSPIARSLVAGMIILGLTVCGCERATPADTSARRPNVLLIVIDTLRADRLGCYGSELGATPRIDALAAEGHRFERAYAHAPWTLPSFASLFTSQAPPRHGAGGQLRQFLPLQASARTVAEVFRDAGFATSAIINVDFIAERFGMMQGFDHVDFVSHASNENERTAEGTTSAAAALLASKSDRPFFLLVHYFDPHLIYDPPPEYRARYGGPLDRDNRDWQFGQTADVIAYRHGKFAISEETIRRAELLYNGEVAYTDAQVGRLLDELMRLGLADSTIVVLTADHGEEFLDHGGFEHGHTLYNELLHVPLIIRYPRWVATGVSESMVGLIDVAPTLCDLAGLDADPAFAGHSLAGLMEGAPWAQHPIYLSGNFWGKPFHGWINEEHKLIASPNEVMLFNLAADPRERQNLTNAKPGLARRMATDMQLAFKAMRATAPGRAQPLQLSDAERKRLESLGYLRSEEP